jgi:Amt family ammonium transporter
LEGVTAAIMTTQLIGIVAAFVWAFGTAFILFKLISMTIGLRISEEDELLGVDIVEHGAHAYNDFQTMN